MSSKTILNHIRDRCPLYGAILGGNIGSYGTYKMCNQQPPELRLLWSSIGGITTFYTTGIILDTFGLTALSTAGLAILSFSPGIFIAHKYNKRKNKSQS